MTTTPMTTTPTTTPSGPTTTGRRPGPLAGHRPAGLSSDMTTIDHPNPTVDAATDPGRPGDTTPYWAWCGAHGGAGVTTLAEAVPGGVDLGRRLPWEACLGHLPAVAVCRSTAHGLLAAREFAARATGRTALLGLVVVADMPERKRPRVLADSLYVTRGAFNNRVWEMPWVGPWRLGDPPSRANNPQEVRDLLTALWTAVNLPLPGGSRHQARSRR
jgi:hypothetical protein